MNILKRIKLEICWRRHSAEKDLDASARYFGRYVPDKLPPLARPCDTCTTNISQAIDHDSVECFETCAAYSLWSEERGIMNHKPSTTG